MRSIVRFDSGSKNCSATLRASSARLSSRTPLVGRAHLSALGHGRRPRASGNRQGWHVVGHNTGQGIWPHARACLRQIGLTERHQRPPRAALAKGEPQDRGVEGRRSPGCTLAAIGRRRNHGIAHQPMPLGMAARETATGPTARREVPRNRKHGRNGKRAVPLLAMANIWDLIAGRVGHAPRCGSAVTGHGRA
jgi:hypothetical protein